MIPRRVSTCDFESIDAMLRELQYARIYGGMHFRTSTAHGAVLGRKTVAWLNKHNFQPVDDK